MTHISDLWWLASKHVVKHTFFFWAEMWVLFWQIFNQTSHGSLSIQLSFSHAHALTLLRGPVTIISECQQYFTLAAPFSDRGGDLKRARHQADN